MSNFSGSYLQDDVNVLLKPIDMEDTPVEEKEHLIQVEKRHYSEMITRESLPSEQYLKLFHQIFAQNHHRLAVDLIILALKICQRKQGEITLISLARAGTPIGVLLKRILEQRFKRVCHHYSISIIRDRGLDANALQHIIEQHPDTDSFAFIDGWTGKGVINRELNKSVSDFNREFDTRISPDLYVLNDIAGVAAVTASFDDYLIPSSLLNSTISGLISRSILNDDYIGEDDFHGCLFYEEFLEHDLSNWFVSETMRSVADAMQEAKQLFDNQHDHDNKDKVQKQSVEFMAQTQRHYGITNINLIKPGIGEATRVLLRRMPDLVILKDLKAEETRHLLMLGKEKQVPVVENPDMPYQALSIIKDVTND